MRAVIERWTGGLSVLLYCDPVPASRPRVTRWGTYYTKTYKAYKEHADKAIPLSDAPPLTGNLHADVEIICPKPKTTIRLNPKGDIDNHIKSIFDAIVGTKKNPKRYLRDDDQIVTCTAVKRWAEQGEEPHTRIRLVQL